jgi:hypothetical protein
MLSPSEQNAPWLREIRIIPLSLTNYSASLGYNIFSNLAHYHVYSEVSNNREGLNGDTGYSTSGF